MKGDKLYCKSCQRISNDVWTMYDTRYNGAHVKYIGKIALPELNKRERFQPRCPFCESIHLINATQLIEEGDRLLKQNASANNWTYMELYVQVKQILKTKDLNNVANK